MTSIVGFPEGRTPYTVYSTPDQRRKKLAELVIPEEVLVRAIQLGLTEKLTAEIYDPRTAGGYDFFRYTTKYLRRSLAERGWQVRDPNNIALVRDPINGTIVIVCAGDSQTGTLIGDQPRSRRTKGDLFLETTEVVAKDLLGEDIVRKRRLSPPMTKVWLLLHYHDGEGANQVLRAELSRPFEAEAGFITKWVERIILHVPLPTAFVDDVTADDQGPEITPSLTIRL